MKKYTVPGCRDGMGDRDMPAADEYRRAAQLMQEYVAETGYEFPFDREAIERTREEFLVKFGPERLAELPDEKLLQAIFYSAGENRDCLCYQLEKNADCRKYFGSVAGGSTYKFGLFQKQNTGMWTTGSPQKPKAVGNDKMALPIGKRIRDALVKGAETVRDAELYTLADYEKLDDDLTKVMGAEYSRWGWVHKYLSMVCPDKLSGFHSTDWQCHVLYALQIRPGDRYYARSGQLAMVQNSAGWHYCELISAVRERFGGIKQFLRLGTSDDAKNYAAEWAEKSVVGMGWPEIGSLEDYAPEGSLDRDAVTESLLNSYYPKDRSTASRKAGELKRFYETGGDTVFVAMDGERLLAFVDQPGQYFYDESSDMPNRKPGIWHCRFPEGARLPVRSEGLQTSCYPLTKKENLMYLYGKYFYGEEPEMIIDSEENRRKAADCGQDNFIPPEYYTGFQSEYERNRILFGAPGTGKSYRLKLDAEELIGYAEDHMERVTFHPEYSYSQFVGTYRPVTDEKGDIQYQFEPGPFMRVYVNALKEGRQRQKVSELIRQAKVMHLFPTNPESEEEGKRWNLFEEITETGQQETFRCARGAAVGDLALIYVRETETNKNNGIYAVGTITGKQGEDVAVIRFDYVSYYEPIIDYRTLKKYSPNVRSSGKVNEKIAELVKNTPLPANPYLLLIEEINRARTAAVFGDIFQLLDRDEDGVSMYEIQVSEDVRWYLARQLGGKPQQWKNIRLPDNMFLWASMNSADQGVFPMDTAFRRRWEFEYLGIDEGEEEMNSGIVTLGEGSHVFEADWNCLRKAINRKLAKDYRLNEDKLIGPFFLAGKITEPDEDGYIADPDGFIRAFKRKIIMYLYEDAARQHRYKLFSGCDNTCYSAVCAAFDEIGIDIFGDGFRELYRAQEG